MKKTCSQCGETKAADQYQTRKMSRDGLTAACKECLSKRDKKRANSPERVAARKAYAKTPRGLERSNAAKKAWLERNAESRSAHNLTWSAIKNGRLVRLPCEECGTDENVIAHHDDYCKPLDVRWLCVKHHAQHHKKTRDAKRSQQ